MALGGRSELIALGVMNWGEMMADLNRAVQPGSPRSVLAVFGFSGLKDHLETMTWSQGDTVLERLAARLTEAVGGTARVYAPRRGEFCTLFEGELGTGWTEIPAALDEEASLIGIGASSTLVVLTGEAASPTGAMRLANHRLQAQGVTFRSEVPRRF